MTDKNFKLPKAMKRLSNALGKRDSVFKKLIIQATVAAQKFANRRVKRNEE